MRVILKNKATLIDYSIVILMMPCIMIGSFLGVQINVIAPQIVIMFVLMGVLIVVSYITTVKSLKLYREDKGNITEVKNHSFLSSGNSEEESKEIEMDDLHYDNSWELSIEISNMDTEKMKMLKNIKKAERSHFGCSKFMIILVSLGLLILVSSIRKNLFQFLGALQKCSGADILLCLCFLLLLIGVTAWSILMLKREYRIKQEIGYTFINGDIRWNNQIIISMSTVAILCGSLASLVGLGGGVIYGPLMLAYNVNPKVSSATGMYMVMLGTFSTSIQFLMMGVLPVDYALFLGIIIVITAIVGNFAVAAAVRRSGKISLIAVLLAGVLIFWTVIVFWLSIYKIMKQLKEGENMLQFNPYWHKA